MIWDEETLDPKHKAYLEGASVGDPVVVMEGNPGSPEYYRASIEKASKEQVWVRGKRFQRFNGRFYPEKDGQQPSSLDPRIFPLADKYAKRAAAYARQVKAAQKLKEEAKGA